MLVTQRTRYVTQSISITQFLRTLLNFHNFYIHQFGFNFSRLKSFTFSIRSCGWMPDSRHKLFKSSEFTLKFNVILPFTVCMIEALIGYRFFFPINVPIFIASIYSFNHLNRSLCFNPNQWEKV